MPKTQNFQNRGYCPPKTTVERVEQAFDRQALKRICEMHEEDFARTYDMELVPVRQKAPDDFYCFVDNGSDVLAVAHLDTVGLHHERTANFLDTEGGPVIYSRALDDRLGAYVILELLPALGITCDILLTVGEENGRSTAAFFEPSKEYNWMIEFDRGGTDVVMYQYEDKQTIDLVQASGAQVGDGIFSDICYLEHMEVKGFNWGVGYRDYHGPRSHAYLDDTISMVSKFLKFHEANVETYLPHEHEDDVWRRLFKDAYSEYDEYDDDGFWDEEGHWRDGATDQLATIIDLDEDFIENPTSEQMRAALTDAGDFNYYGRDPGLPR